MATDINTSIHVFINDNRIESFNNVVIIPNNYKADKDYIVSEILELLIKNNEVIKSNITNHSYIQISIDFSLDDNNSDIYKVAYYMKRHIFLPNEYYMIQIKPTSPIKSYYDNNKNGIEVRIDNDINTFITKEKESINNKSNTLRPLDLPNERKEIVGPTKITDTNTIKYLRCLFMDKGCPTQLPTMYYYY